MKSLELKAKGLLKRYSAEFVIDKMDAEKTGRTTRTQIKRIVEALNKTV